MIGSTARVTFNGPNRVVSICARKSSGLYLLEEPGVEVAGIVDEHVDTAEALDGGLDGGLGVRATGDVELDDEQIVRFADGRGHGVRVAARCDNGIAGR